MWHRQFFRLSLDLRLDRADFLQALNSTHNKLRFSAPLDEKHLDRVTGTATFYSVTPEKLRLLASIRKTEDHYFA